MGRGNNGGGGGRSPQERMAAQVDTDILVEKEQTIMELRDTVEVRETGRETGRDRHSGGT